MIIGMKHILILFTALMSIIAALLLALPATPAFLARADERYAVAETADVFLYAEENEESKLFAIPRTYYVKVLSQGEKFTKCEYQRDSVPYTKITGYCLTNSLTFVDFTPDRPFLSREVTATYTLAGAKFGEGKFSKIEESYAYYGTRYVDGQLYFYVGKSGVCDYIPADEELIFDLNTDYLPEPETPTASGGTVGALSAVQIVFITLSAVAVLVVAVFVAHGKKSERAENFEV